MESWSYGVIELLCCGVVDAGMQCSYVVMELWSYAVVEWWCYGVME